MSEERERPMVTLNGDLAHNALAAAVQMYQGVLADRAREHALLASTVRAAKAAEAAADARIKDLERSSASLSHELAMKEQQREDSDARMRECEGVLEKKEKECASLRRDMELAAAGLAEANRKLDDLIALHAARHLPVREEP